MNHRLTTSHAAPGAGKCVQRAPSLSRRKLLEMIGATAIASQYGRGLSAQTKDKGLPAPGNGWIDVHHHISPPTFAKVLTEKGLLPKPLDRWSLEKTLEDMDKGGVAAAMNSIVSPGVWFGEPKQARALARECNEYAARLAADHPGRFGNFATLLLPDVEGSLQEIGYAFDTLRADGVMLFTSYGDKWLGDPAFAPVYEELNRRRAVVFIHPTNNACCVNLLPDISSAEIEYGTETTRAIVRMVYSGSAKRYPDIRLIFSHGGGTMPSLIGRFVNRTSRGSGVRDQHDFQAEISRFYYDTAQTFHPVPMTALKHVVPTTQILFGTDYPYRSSSESTRGLIAGAAFDAGELEMVKRGNALQLMPQFRTGDLHSALAPAVRDAGRA